MKFIDWKTIEAEKIGLMNAVPYLALVRNERGVFPILVYRLENRNSGEDYHLNLEELPQRREFSWRIL